MPDRSSAALSLSLVWTEGSKRYVIYGLGDIQEQFKLREQHSKNVKSWLGWHSLFENHYHKQDHLTGSIEDQGDCQGAEFVFRAGCFRLFWSQGHALGSPFRDRWELL